MSESYMARLGARLVDNGYPVLPIMPGTKKPGLFKRRRLARLPRLDRSTARGRPPSTSWSSGAAGRTPASASRPAP